MFTAGSAEAGGENKKPTARVASGGGFETFSSVLAVSPRAGSENSALHRSRHSRLRHGHGNSLHRDREHTKNRLTQAGASGKLRMATEEPGWRCVVR